jgi:hypothetical protein
MEKTKKKVTPQKEELTLPVKAFVNKYNFLRINDAILKKLGWPTGEKVPVMLDVQNGVLIIKKRS